MKIDSPEVTEAITTIWNYATANVPHLAEAVYRARDREMTEAAVAEAIRDTDRALRVDPKYILDPNITDAFAVHHLRNYVLNPRTLIYTDPAPLLALAAKRPTPVATAMITKFYATSVVPDLVALFRCGGSPDTPAAKRAHRLLFGEGRTDVEMLFYVSVATGMPQLSLDVCLFPIQSDKKARTRLREIITRKRHFLELTSLATMKKAQARPTLAKALAEYSASVTWEKDNFTLDEHWVLAQNLNEVCAESFLEATMAKNPNKTFFVLLGAVAHMHSDEFALRMIAKVAADPRTCACVQRYVFSRILEEPKH